MDAARLSKGLKRKDDRIIIHFVSLPKLSRDYRSNRMSSRGGEDRLCRSTFTNNYILFNIVNAASSGLHDVACPQSSICSAIGPDKASLVRLMLLVCRSGLRLLLRFRL